MPGITWDIEYFETAKGRRPVQEFVDSLDARSKAKIARTLDLLEESGIMLGMPMPSMWKETCGNSASGPDQASTESSTSCTREGYSFFSMDSRRSPARSLNMR